MTVCNHKYWLTNFLYFFIPFFFSITLLAQKPKKDTKAVKVINVDLFVFETTKKKGKEIRRLLGNVELQQKDVIVKCDSAHLYFKENDIEAYGDVHIQQGDSVDIYADYLFYDGATKIAKLYNNVQLSDKTSDIKADSLIYYTIPKKAILEGNVYLTDQKSDVYSDSLVYFVEPKQAYLYDNVRLKDKTTNVQADSLAYNVQTEYAELYGRVEMQDKETTAKADIVKYDIKKKYARLYGNVDLVDKQVKSKADSVYYQIPTQHANLYGRVMIQDDKMKAEADSIEYKGQEKQAYLYENVRIEQDGATLTTRRMDYNMDTKEGIYTGGGKLVKEETTLTSDRGRIYGGQDKVLFEDNVHLVSPDYDLKTDQLDYNTKTENADFSGETTIINESGTLQTNQGSFNRATNELILKDRAVINNPPQQLIADQFQYSKQKGYGNARGNVVWIDTSQQIKINSQYANFYDEDKRVEAYEEVLLRNVSNEDTLYLSADTLVMFSVPDTINNTGDSLQVLYAYHEVKILNKDIQGLCDSLIYSLVDSTFRMYTDPVLWLDEYQLYADTMFLSTRNNKPYRINMYSNAFIGSKLLPNVYNQVAGKKVTGYFKQDTLERILVDGNAESIFYAQNEAEEFIGVNKSSSSKMWVYMANRTVDKISFLSKPTATMYPIQQIQPKNFILKGFTWFDKKRPITLQDLLL